MLVGAFGLNQAGKSRSAAQAEALRADITPVTVWDTDGYR
jgi:hypothetical protein